MVSTDAIRRTTPLSPLATGNAVVPRPQKKQVFHQGWKKRSGFRSASPLTRQGHAAAVSAQRGGLFEIRLSVLDQATIASGRFPLPAPPNQTKRAQAGGEER